MQGAVLEEYGFDQACVDRGEEALTGVLVGGKVGDALHGDQGAGLLAGHVHARQHNGGDVVSFVLLFGRAVTQELAYLLPALGRTDGHEYLLDLVLEDDHQDDEADVDELVQQSPHQPHLKHLRDQKPEDEEGDDPHEDRSAPRVAQGDERIVEEDRHQEDVDDILDRYVEPRKHRGQGD